MKYEPHLEYFQGPLEKLLELIESRQLEITEISLAEVTDDFLRYLKTLTDAEKNAEQRRSFRGSPREVREVLRLVSDFIVVASRLLLLKSKSLLSQSLTEEEETEIKDLEERLKRYRELRPAMKIIAKLWQNRGQEFSRPYFGNLSFFLSAESGSGVFYPGSKLTLDALSSALQKIFEDLEKLLIENRVLKEKIVSIEDKIKEIISRLQKLKEINFRHLARAKSRSEIITVFLAILHLAHEHLILLEQNNRFSDIMIKQSEKSLPAGR